MTISRLVPARRKWEVLYSIIVTITASPCREFESHTVGGMLHLADPASLKD